MAPKVLVTGGNGMLGSSVVRYLRQRYGHDNVIASDIRRGGAYSIEDPFEICDITDFNRLSDVVAKHKVDWLINMCAVLSVAGENNPQLAMKVNIEGFHNLMEVSRLNNLRIFSPSATAAFGPSTPKEKTPDVTIMRPTNIYGVCKVHNELVGEFYHKKYRLDFRCLRFPSIITEEGEGSGRVIDYVFEIFVKALTTGSFICDVSKNAKLPFLYLKDCVEGTVAFMEADEALLKQRVYNVAALSISPGDIAAEITKHLAKFSVKYVPDEVKMSRINTLPVSFDDSNARKDWKWCPKYNLEKVVAEMMQKLKKKLDLH